MTAFRFRWRPLVAVVLAVIWIVGVVRYVSRDAKVPAPLTTYVPAAPASPPVPHAVPAEPAVVPAAPAAPPVAPAPAVTPVAPAPAGTPVASPPTVAPAAPPSSETPAVSDAPDLHTRLWAAVPAVTSDGSRIFMPYSGEDGARGLPNLIFYVWDRHGKVVRQQLVQSVDQYLGVGGPPEAPAQVKAQEVAAGKLLDELEHQGLQPLAPDEANQPTGDRTHYAYLAEGERAPSLTIDLSTTGTLTVKPKGHAAITRHNDGWRTAPSPKTARWMQAQWDQGKEGCFNAAQLGETWVDLSRRLVVVAIGYHGNDTCWEPAHDVTVLAW